MQEYRGKSAFMRKSGALRASLLIFGLAGAALSVSNGATVYLNHSDLVVDGAQRYVTETSGTSTLIVNDSNVTQTGSNAFTSKMTEPFSNNALLISGIARANMSVGLSKTYYFNSTVTTEGWAALSTDAAAAYAAWIAAGCSAARKRPMARLHSSNSTVDSW